MVDDDTMKLVYGHGETEDLQMGVLSTAEGTELSFHFRMKDVSPSKRSVPSVVPPILPCD